LAHGGFAAANAQEALQQKLAALNGAVIVGRLREHLRKEVGERREEKDARGTRKRHENKRVRKHKPELRYFKIIRFFFSFHTSAPSLQPFSQVPSQLILY
jgi:hypothetical protein